MRTVVCTELGPLDTLSVEDRGSPVPGEGFVQREGGPRPEL